MKAISEESERVIEKTFVMYPTFVIMTVPVLFIGFGLISYFIAIFGGQTIVSLLLVAYGSIVQFLPLACPTFFWK